MICLHMLYANIVHAVHSILHGLVDHRLMTSSIKPVRAKQYTVAEIKCECGKSFYRNETALKQFNELTTVES